MADETDFLFAIVPLVICVIVYFLFCGGSKNQRQEVQNKTQPTTISQRPIVTITSNNILTDYKDEVDDGTKAALKILAKRVCIFVFVVVKDKEEAERVKPKIAEQLSGLVEPRNILPCQTAIGRASMARQLESVAHFDYDPEAILQSSIFIPSILIAPSSVESPKAKWSCESFQNFMTSGNTEFFALLPK